MVPTNAMTLLHSLYDLCDSMQDTPMIKEILQKANSDLTLREILHLDICTFLMYLSASDGHINSAEAAYISEIFEGQLSPEQITSIIEQTDIYSTSFESRAPLSLHIFVAIDNALYDANKRFDKTATEILVEFYQALGQHFINCDANIAANERSDLSIYLNTMKAYINKESKFASSTDIGSYITKKTTSQNTLKAKYETIKKK